MNMYGTSSDYQFDEDFQTAVAKHRHNSMVELVVRMLGVHLDLTVTWLLTL